jgi:hypothetical protein
MLTQKAVLEELIGQGSISEVQKRKKPLGERGLPSLSSQRQKV